MARDSFTVEADHDLHQAILAVRKSGKRHGDRIISCTMAFELGARILLDMEEREEDVIKQEIEDLKIQEAELDQRKRVRQEQLRLMEASRTVKLSEASEQNDNVQKLAQRIIDVWDSVLLDKNHTVLGSLVNIDKDRLNKVKIESIFPARYKPKPSIDEAVGIAMNLLEGENLGA